MTGSTPERVNRCPSCGSERRHPVLEAEHVDGSTLRLFRCDACGLVYLADHLPVFEEELYEYYRRYAGRPKSEIFSALNAKGQRRLLAQLDELAPGRDLLDVGCGIGQLVHTALGSGWRARGIDLAEPAIAVCQSLGLPCEVLDFFDLSLDAERFDVVVMSELIEHVPNPRTFLARAAELLRPGGVLYLTTPNFGALSRRLAGPAWKPIHPEHLSYFTARSLRRLAEPTGLRLEAVDTRNFSLESLGALVRPRRRRGEGGAPAPRRPTSSATRSVPPSQRLRRALDRFPAVGEPAKGLANWALDLGSLGDTLVCVARKVD